MLRVRAEVQVWAQQRSLFTMLNELNVDQPDLILVTKPPPTFSPVNRAYKRLLPRIHPDKHVCCGGSEEAFHLMLSEFWQYFLQFKLKRARGFSANGAC